MKNLLHRLALLLLSLWLAACASTANTSAQGSVPMPGDAQFYGFGVGQSKVDFANVEIAQYNLGMYKTQRTWIRMNAGRGASWLGLRAYYPFDVRWKLKDGREFILENIDTSAIMREYFKTNNFLLQHQREKREKVLGDANPSLQFGIKDDAVVIKWGLTLILTPLDKRFPIIVNGIPSVDGTLWKTEYEEHFVTTLKGSPTSGIDFTKTWEFFK